MLMWTDTAEKLLALFVLGLGILILMLADIIARFNRTKAWICVVLGALFFGVGGYYAYLAFTEYSAKMPNVATPTPAVTRQQPAAVPAAPPADFKLVISVSGASAPIIALPDDEIELSKRVTFTLKEIRGLPPDPTTRANLVGFVPRPSDNTGQDIGYPISFGRIQQRKAMTADECRRHGIDVSHIKPGEKVFKIEIKQKDDVLGHVFLKFVD